MQLAKSTIEQNYLKQIHALESAIKTAVSDPIDYSALDDAQEKLDALATRYQHNKTIGNKTYKLYELQAFVHYYNGNHEEALDFIEQAIEIRGHKYERADRLLTMIQSNEAPAGTADAPSSKPSLTDADHDIIVAKAAISGAGFWAIALGIVGLLIALGLLFIGPSAIVFSIIIGMACAYFIVAGSFLVARSDDDTLKIFLLINVIISALFIWTIFPLFILITSAIALKRLTSFNGSYVHEIKQYDTILKQLHQYQNANSIFFYRSPLAVAIFTIITLGFYPLYWVYKHYALISKSTQDKTYPVLSTIFQLFTIYPLMVRIKHAAKQSGYTRFQHAGWAAAGYIILLIFSNAANKAATNSTEQVFAYVVTVLLLSSGTAAIMAVVQRAANASNLEKLGKSHVFRTAYVGEVIMIIIGVIIAILAIVLSFYNATVPAPSTVSPEKQNIYNRIESLRSQYDACSADLTSREGSVDTSNSYEVDTYNSDWQACENTRLELNSNVDAYNAAL
ncbi:MAG: DUF4234 domain-containing protein [Acidobacteriota bacterium]